MSSSPWPAAGAAVAALALAAGEAQAETRPLRVEYEAHEACPAGDAFLAEVLARTSRARAAAEGEPAMDVWVRITLRGRRSIGRLVLWKGSGTRAREVDSERCADVVSALALITALALDPNASLTPRPAQPVTPPEPSAPPAPATPPAVPPSIPPAPDPWAMPLAVVRIPVRWPAPPPEPPPQRRWVIGAHLAASFDVTPRPLLGGGLAAERSWDSASGSAGVALRLGVEVASTGSFDIGPGGVTFLRAAARLDGCPFLRPVAWLGLAACLGAEAGVLRGEGLPRGSIASVQVASVPWAGLGLGPRLSFDLGESGVLALDGGPLFPLVRRSFVFSQPDYTIHEVPAVTWAARLAVGIRF